VAANPELFDVSIIGDAFLFSRDVFVRACFVGADMESGHMVTALRATSYQDMSDILSETTREIVAALSCSVAKSDGSYVWTQRDYTAWRALVQSFQAVQLRLPLSARASAVASPAETKVTGAARCCLFFIFIYFFGLLFLFVCF